tara:strand:+ start:4244 stop:4552 length:309 start_codon:yes stop_codon:yes gene_type:complete
MRQNRISINDIKWDLIRIIEPWDGRLENKPKSEEIISKLFNGYLADLAKENKIQDFTIVGSIRDTAITYDVAVKVSADRSPKKLKIHVGIFQHPWITKKAAA